MGKSIKIAVNKEMGSFLNSREAAIQLVSIIRNNSSKDIDVDFSSVDFMSRSFADQFHKEQMKLEGELGVMVHLVNANEEIINVLNVVAKTQVKKEREYKPIPVYKFSDSKLLSDYLFAI